MKRLMFERFSVLLRRAYSRVWKIFARLQARLRAKPGEEARLRSPAAEIGWMVGCYSFAAGVFLLIEF